VVGELQLSNYLNDVLIALCLNLPFFLLLLLNYYEIIFCNTLINRYRPFPCARLRNLPFDATLEDILILFQGLVVIDVVLIGQGEAFVIFANPMDYQMALQR
jgi:hypothetical protein